VTTYYYYRYLLPPPRRAVPPAAVAPPAAHSDPMLVEQQREAILDFRKKLDEQGASLADMRKALHQQEIAVKELEKGMRAQPLASAEVVALRDVNKKNGTQLADQAKLIDWHGAMISYHTRAIDGVEQKITELAALSGGTFLLLVILLVIALWKGGFKRSRKEPSEELFWQAMAKGRPPTQEEITAMWNRISGLSA